MFSIRETIKYGWNKSKEHMELVFFATLLILALSAFMGGVGDNRNFLFGLILVIFVIIVKIGYKKLLLRIHDGESPSFADIFKEYRTFWRYLGACILVFLVVILGLVLLILPGIFWAVRFSFAHLIVIDTKSGPVAAMRESYSITKGSFWKLLWFWIVMGLLNLAGAVVFGIGLLVTVPVTTFAAINVYRTLSKSKAALAAPSPQQS